ncbi:MAG: ABC transporter ATP-binding protein [Deltaproteobacteria bacterium]|nr:ABC transporter ATP-binding protein [Deltaproteobacteria bacterium]
MKIFKRLIRLLWLEHREIKLVLAYGVAFSFLNLVFPLGAQAIFSNINYGTLLQPVILVSFLVFGLLGLSSILRGFQVYLIEIIQRRIFSRITLSIGRFIPYTKSGSFTVELMNRFFEVVNVQKMQYLILMDGLGTIFQTLLGLLLLAFYHPYLLIFNLLFLLCLYIIIFIVGLGGTRTSIEESKEKYKVADWLEEITRHKKIFSSPKGASFALNKTDDFIMGYLTKRINHFKILFRQYIGTFILFVFGNVGTLLLGSWLVIKGELTVGQLVAMEIIVSGITANLVKFGKYIESMYDLMASYDKLESIFKVPHNNSRDEETIYQDSIKSIHLKNIVYHHPKIHAHMGRPLRFNDIKVSIGEKIAVFAKSGSGKSTLANIICGFKEFHEGEYLINGVSVRELPLKQVFHRFFLLEKPALFRGTILQNITMSESAEDKERLIELMKRFPYSKEIFNLEDGISTYVHGSEDEFSDRLMTIISFLRAIYAVPDCLVIDQTFDALHDDFSQGLIEYLQEQCPKMSVIIFTSNQDVQKHFSRQISVERP